MMRKILSYLVAILILANMNLFAQDDKDTTAKDWHKRTRHNWFKSDWKWRFHGSPFIEVNYGMGTPKSDKLVSKFADVGLLEVKLGYSTINSFNEDIVDFNDKFVFVSRLSADIKKSDATLGVMKSSLLRIGFEERSGYGYKIGNVAILPYISRGAAWSRLLMIDYPAQFYLNLKPQMSLQDAINDTDILNRYHDNVRFGTVWEAGIRLDYSKAISLDAGYQASVVFPRYMFWKHVGSAIIEEAGLKALDNFIDEITDSSPYVAPIVNFLLKNGYSYAFYALKKEKMNWPFATEAPLTYETFKFGVTFTF
jgi:hypothetical protein